MADNDLELQVKWSLSNITWELISSHKDLEARDKYLELQGVKRTHDLLQRVQVNWSPDYHVVIM